MMAPGTYEPATLHRLSKRLIAPRGGVIVRSHGPHLAAQPFWRNPETKLWVTRLPLRYAATILRVLHSEPGSDGYERRMPRYRKLAALAAAEAGWHFEAETRQLTVRSGVSPASLRAVFTNDGGLSALTNKGGHLIVDGEFTFDGVAIYGVNSDGLSPSVSLRDCSILFTDGPAVRIEDGDFYGENVRIFAPSADGLSYVGRGLGVEVNCRVMSAGDPETEAPPAQNCNASSAHDAYEIARFGGIYERSYGPDIADGGDKPSYSWNVGVLTRGSLVNVGIGLYQNRTAWLDTCAIEGDFVVDGSAARSFDCRFGRVVLQGGRHETYDPASP